MTRPVKAGAEGVPVRFVSESLYDAAATAEALIPAPRDGGLRLVTESAHVVADNALAQWLAGRAGGPVASTWTYGRYLKEGATEICRVGPVWWFPRYGVLIDAQGHTPEAPSGEARHNWSMLDPLPGMGGDGETPMFTPPARVRRLPASTVAMPWGMSNYGHFLFDGLTSILAVEETGLLDRFPLVVPPLNRWQRSLVRAVFGDIALREVAAPVVQLEGALFSTAMDHFLHMPGPLVPRLRERARAALPKPTRRGRRLYISRRRQHMRVMVDEPALEAALAARGFEIVRPERLAVADQLRLFREADIVVGASGAGLANALFCDAGAHVIEIQPENFTSFWTAAFCRAAGLEWSGYFCASPGASEDAPWFSRIRRGFKFAYRLDVPDFIAFLETRI